MGPLLRKLLALALVLLAVRMALPLVVAPLLAGRLSRLLGARVEIGDVGLNPLDAVFTLHDFAVYAPAHPQPPIAADQLVVDVQWLPLLHRTLRVRELALQSGHVDLDLLPDGGFAIAGTNRPDVDAELPSSWRFALDRVTLRDARLRARDADADAAPFLEAEVRAASFAAAERRTAVFGKATNMSVDATIGGGRLRFEGHYALREEGLSFDARAVVTDVPLAQLLSRVGERGFTDLSGILSAKLRWRRDPHRIDELSGRAVVRDVRATVAGLDEPAFAARRAVAEISEVDLARRQITVQALSLKGATLALRPDIAAPVPLIAAALAATTAPGGRAGATAAVRPWSWTVKRLDARNARLRIVAGGEPTAVRADAVGENIGTDAYWSPLRVELEYGDIAAAFDGTLRVAGSPPLEGRLTTGELDLAPLARGAGLPWAELVQDGRAAFDLNVGFDASAGQDSPFYARGAINLSNVWIAEPDPGGVSFAADRVALTLDGFSLREPRPEDDERRHHARRIRFSDALVDAPVVHLLRKRDGDLLVPASPSPDTPDIAFDRLRVTGGTLTLVDLAPIPAVTWQITQLAASTRATASPAVHWDHLELSGNDRRFGDFQVAASVAGGARVFELNATDVPLAATAPYLALAGVPTRFTAGRGSINAAGTIAAGGWQADTTLVLDAPALDDVDSLQRALGMPLADALRQLRDEDGRVTVRMALATPRGDGASYVERAAAGMRDALARRARSAEPESFSAVTVLFSPGRAELTDTARRELAALADLLDRRGDVVVELSADTSRADQRWLAEQALGGMLEEKKGIGGLLRTLGIGRDRERIRKALAARARGEAGVLGADDQELLEELLAEAPPVSENRLADLRQARLQAVVAHLSAAGDIAGERLVVRRDATRGGVALAAVRAQAVLSPTAPAGDAQEPPFDE